MKQVVETLAITLDKMKAKNPLTFCGLVTALIMGIVALDTQPYFEGEYSEFYNTLKYLLIGITGFSSSSTYNHLPETHPKKQKTVENEPN